MTSIRRALSLVPRPGTLRIGEASSLASPPSKSSSYAQHYHPLSGSPPLLLCVFSLESSKVKEQVWRTPLLHFFISFTIGIFIGLTPFLSVTSVNQPYIFQLVHSHDNTTTNVIPQQDSNRKLLIIVTPTYCRSFQAYYLNRLAQTLKHVPPPLLWIVVEMASQSSETTYLLRRTGIMYRHLVCNTNLTDIKAHQRNVALSHIQTHRLDGIVYFADDDNFYSLHLFEHMRQIRRFGTWMVSKFTENKSKCIMEGPICNGSQVIGWHINSSTRRFYADISGFAFNSSILWDLKVDTVKQGRSFVEQVVEDESQMEGLPHGCSRVMVWHSRMKPFTSLYPHHWLMKNNLDALDALASKSLSKLMVQ